MNIKLEPGMHIMSAESVKMYYNTGNQVTLPNTISTMAIKIDNTNSDQRDLLLYDYVDVNANSIANTLLYKYSDNTGGYNKIIIPPSIRGNNHITKIEVYGKSNAKIYTISDVNYSGGYLDIISIFSSDTLNTSNVNISSHINNYGSHIDDIIGSLVGMPEYALIDQNTSKGIFKKVPDAYISRFVVSADGSMRYLGEIEFN